MALAAARWTARSLTPRNREFLAALPLGPVVVDGAFEICHGSPARRGRLHLLRPRRLRELSRVFDSAVCFFGHSHIPSIFTLEPHGIRVEVVDGERVAYRLEEGRRYLINPGSVGQPRDRNPTAAYAIYDAKKGVVLFERVAYDAERTRREDPSGGPARDARRQAAPRRLGRGLRSQVSADPDLSLRLGPEPIISAS